MIAPFLLVAALAVDAAVPAAPVSLSLLSWLGGCWQRTTPDRVVEEQWMAPAGGVMLGMSRAVRTSDGSLVEFEQVRIEARGDSAVYVANPARQAMATFTAIAYNDSLILFENKAHDFPQRIGYRRVGADSLEAWIEGPGKEGTTRRVDYPYRRVACPGRP
ncbi:MAG: DUF6265 family protein [Candidatus Eisenbacteria bacterium]